MKNKGIFLILLLAISLTGILLVSREITYVAADQGGGPPFMDWETAPTDIGASYDRYWDFNNNTIIAWRLKNLEGSSFQDSMKIFNITSMRYLPNATGENVNYYAVMLKQMYFNATLMTVKEYTDLSAHPIVNASLINFTNAQVTQKMLPYDVNGPLGGDPLLANPFIPKNESGALEIPWCANALRWLYGYWLSNGSGRLPTYGAYLTTTSNSIYYYNNTEQTYARLIYDENGILQTGEIRGYIGPPGENHEPQTINYTRTYDFNPVDNLTWPVNINDVLYINNYSTKLRFTITNFKNINVDTHKGLLTAQVIKANISEWDGNTWVQVRTDTNIAAANEIDPFILSGDIQLQYPYIVPSEVSNLGDALDSWYDKAKSNFYFDMVSHGQNWVKIRNSSTNVIALLKYYKNGLLHVMYAPNNTLWDPRDETKMFFYLTDFPVYLTTLQQGITNQIVFNPSGQSGFQITANISVSRDDILLFSGFTEIPLQNVPSRAIFYFDLHINNTDNLSGPINITITVNTNLYSDFQLFWFNDTANNGEGAWEEIPIQIQGDTISFTIDHLCYFTLSGTKHLIWNWNWDWFRNFKLNFEIPETPPTIIIEQQIIPLGGFFLVFMSLSIIALVVCIKKRNLKIE